MYKIHNNNAKTIPVLRDKYKIWSGWLHATLVARGAADPGPSQSHVSGVTSGRARSRTLLMGGRRADGDGKPQPIDIPEERWMGGEPLFIPRDIWGMIFSFLVEGRGPRCAEVDEAAFAAGIAAAESGEGAR